MNTTSAVESSSAADGGGSNVWELVPSGTRPTIRARSPMTFAAMDVIGATVVTTSERPSSWLATELEFDPLHAATSATPMATTTSRREIPIAGEFSEG